MGTPIKSSDVLNFVNIIVAQTNEKLNTLPARKSKATGSNDQIEVLQKVMTTIKESPYYINRQGPPNFRKRNVSDCKKMPVSGAQTQHGVFDSSTTINSKQLLNITNHKSNQVGLKIKLNMTLDSYLPDMPMSVLGSADLPKS